MENMHKTINEIANKKHYLYIAQQESLPYINDFIDVIKRSKFYLTDKQLEDLLQNKFFISSENENFDEQQYIQSACELSVSDFFYRNFPSTYRYEYQANNTKKDVDSYYEHRQYRYCIEVKCSSYKSKFIPKNETEIRLIFPMRSPEKSVYESFVKELQGLTTENTSGEKKLIVEKSLDNTLKDFLISANSKFSNTSNEDQVNILLVCCDDDIDLLNWYCYLYGHQGLFTDKSFHNPAKYKNVDLVIFTSLFHNHFHFRSNQLTNSRWDLSHCFNIINPNRFRDKVKLEAITNFLENFPNYNDEIKNFTKPPHRKQAEFEMHRFHCFSVDYLELKGINHFHRS